MIFSTDELIERLGEFKQQLAVIGTETVESADFHSGFDRVVRWKERVARFLPLPLSPSVLGLHAPRNALDQRIRASVR